jgi:group I intron endonuclease
MVDQMKPIGIAYLYSITRIETGQRYIGLTINPEVRWWTHRWSAGKSNNRIHRAIAKHGAEAFRFEIIACARTWEDGAQVERQLIEQFRCHVSQGGYNLTTGGEGHAGVPCSPETKERIGRSRRGKPGRPIPPAEREIHREHLLRRFKEDPTAFYEMAQNSMNSRIRNGHLTGRKNSPKTIEKMRDSAKLRWSNVSQQERQAHMRPAISARASTKKL